MALVADYDSSEESDLNEEEEDVTKTPTLKEQMQEEKVEENGKVTK